MPSRRVPKLQPWVLAVFGGGIVAAITAGLFWLVDQYIR